MTAGTLAAVRTALVTGGAGFIGSHVCDALVAEGWECHALDDLSQGDAERLGSVRALHVQDVREAGLLSELCEEIRPEVVLHLAAQVDVRRAVADPLSDASVNVLGTISVLEAARAVGARVVLASTGGAIYGEYPGLAIPTPETAEPRPESPYGLGKLAAEGYCDLYRRLHGLETIVLRLANVYGPRQEPGGEAGVISILCEKRTASQPATIFGDGRQSRDFVHVRDVASAFVAACDWETGTVANIGTGRETTLLELADQLGFDVTLHEPARPGEIRRSCLDASLAAAHGWSPTLSLSEGLADTLAWLRARAASS